MTDSSHLPAGTETVVSHNCRTSRWSKRLAQSQSNRRRFLATASAAGLAAYLVPQKLAVGRSPLQDQVQVGVIGLGGRGLYLLDALLKVDTTRIVAICDVHDEHYRDNAWGTGRKMGLRGAEDTIEKRYGNLDGLFVTSDYRELCARENVDAVVVATPDHWHALCSIEAMDQGKDVYCEKPVAHSFAEGIKIREAVARNQSVFQTGSQQRSDAIFRRAVEIVRNGHLGQLTNIEVGLPPGYDGPQGDATITPPPKGLNYDLWCGPAQKLPYMRARHHRWWRGHRAFGGGVLMDWIGHHNDIAQWSIRADDSGPRSVEAVAWEFPETSIYDTPFQYEIRCEYARQLATSISSRHAIGTKWIGSEGWLHVTRGKMTASNEKWTQKSFDAGSESVYRSSNHLQNFLDCVRSRETCISPADVTLRSITPGFLGYVSNALGRKLTWNAQDESIVSDAEAQEMLLRVDMRSPWSLS